MVVRDRLANALEYVEKLARLGHKVVPDIENYVGKPLYENELAGLPGISKTSEIGGIRSWLKIDRLRKQRSPPPQPDIAEWLQIDPDSLNEPSLVEYRMLTMSLEQAAVLLESGTVHQEDVLANLRDPDLRDVTLRLSTFPEIRQQCALYITNQWKPWQLEEAKRRRTIQVYEGMFSVHKQAQQEGAEFPLELVFCLGLARQKIGSLLINTPVIEQLVEIEIGSDAALHILPRDIEPLALLEPYANHDMAQTELVTQAARKQFADNMQMDRDLHPSENETYWPILIAASVHLAKNGSFLGAERDDLADRSIPGISDELVVTDTWAIVVRRRSDNFLIQDIQRLRDAAMAIEESRIPDSVRKVVEEPEVVEVAREELDFRKAQLGHGGIGGMSSGTGLGHSHDAESRDVGLDNSGQFKSFNAGTDLYFPLPFNEQQVEIMKQLEVNDAKGLLVQGPPGTGKSHTIVNIICHFLAKGQRVLVTSKGERALEVLHDKLPAALGALTVSVLANDQKGLRQLEGAVGLLAERVASVDPEQLLREIKSDEHELLQIDRESHLVNDQIRELARDQLTPPPAVLAAALGVKSSSEIALWSARNAESFAWFEDRPDVTTWPLQDGIRNAVTESCILWSHLGVTVEEVGRLAPEVKLLPSVERIAAVHANLLAAAEIERQFAAGTLVRMAQSDKDRVSKGKRSSEALAEAIAVIDHQDHPWMVELVRSWVSTGYRPHDGSPLFECLGALQQCLILREDVVRHAVEGIHPRRITPDLAEAVAKSAAGQNAIGWFTNKDLKARIHAIQLDGDAPDVDGWRHIAKLLQAHRDIRSAIIRWNTMSVLFGVPLIEEQEHQDFVRELVDCLRGIEGMAQALQRAKILHDVHCAVLQTDLLALFPKMEPVQSLLANRELIASAIRTVEHNLARESLAESRLQLAEWRNIAGGFDATISARIRDFLDKQVGRGSHNEVEIGQLWQLLLDALQDFHANVPKLVRLSELCSDLTNLEANLLSARFTRSATTFGDRPVPAKWEEAWLWAIVQRFLDELDQRKLLREISRKRVDLEHRRRQLLAKIVSNATERALSIKIRRNPIVGSALTTFAAMVRKIGKGTGIRAPRMRRAAKEAMKKAHEAVPCWIMPQWRVSEMLPSEIGSFDLVIFDEASQSDIMALPAMMRGKKALIVGDDKQVSPGAEFIEEATIRQLLHTYLYEMPHKNLMLPGSSLYDLGGVIYPGSRIMLLEHFRCVEPIIGFSQRFYKLPGQPNQIVPVRIAKSSERLNPPLIDVRIEDGVKTNRINRQEAEFIVEEIESIVNDPSMDGRSIGVISMVGSEQAHYIAKHLLDRLGADAYEKFHIACGDSATFQGDERDIMFLSLVHSPGQATSLSGLTWQQRFNVAVSRARDRVYLVRSIDKNQLNLNGMQFALIDYVERPEGVESIAVVDRRKLCESAFELEVFDRLTELGYQVIPQVRSGRFRIDLVVEGGGDHRLAIELDGDKHHGPDRWFEDFARQQVLERVGWYFWRCFASAWYRDPKAMLGELVNELHRMEIGPHIDYQSADARNQIVLHRTWLSSEGRKRANSEQVAAESTQEPSEVDSAHPTSRAEMAALSGIVPASAAEEKVPEQMNSARAELAGQFASVEEPRFAALPAADGIEIGDKVAIQYADGGRIYTITISDVIHDTDKGFWRVGYPMADALFGHGEHDVIEIETPQGQKTATILGVQKADRHSLA